MDAYSFKRASMDFKKKGDSAKVAIRNIRRDANEAFKKKMCIRDRSCRKHKITSYSVFTAVTPPNRRSLLLYWRIAFNNSSLLKSLSLIHILLMQVYRSAL